MFVVYQTMTIFLILATADKCFGEAQAVQGTYLPLPVLIQPTATHQSSESAVQAGWLIAITTF